MYVIDRMVFFFIMVKWCWAKTYIRHHEVVTYNPRHREIATAIVAIQKIHKDRLPHLCLSHKFAMTTVS